MLAEKIVTNRHFFRFRYSGQSWKHKRQVSASPRPLCDGTPPASDLETPEADVDSSRLYPSDELPIFTKTEYVGDFSAWSSPSDSD